jgi:circadian clock protein KaiC
VAAPEPPEIRHAASTERISAGFDRLDTMLGGGVFRGSSTLITGVPGTSKTTLAAKFAEAACQRGERTLFVSFDEGAEPIMRNLASVGIELRRHVKSGLLFMYSARTESTGAEDHLAKLKTLMRTHEPRNLVIDPLSAIAKAGGLAAARAVANRLIYMVKDQGVTVMVTAISEGDDPQSEATELEISTVADTWIHLSYVVCGGERNRALTIIKSRGTCHSNQVRELVLSAAGPELSDVYAVEGNVLMGTLRWQKENEDRLRKQQDRSDADRKLRELQQAGSETRAQIKALELDLQRQMAEIALHSREDLADSLASSRAASELRQRRSADPDRSANGGARPAAKRRSARKAVSHAR